MSRQLFLAVFDQICTAYAYYYYYYYIYYYQYQWLMCNWTQGNAVPHFQFIVPSVLPPQIVTMLGKGTRPLTAWPKRDCTVTSNFAL